MNTQAKCERIGPLWNTKDRTTVHREAPEHLLGQEAHFLRSLENRDAEQGRQQKVVRVVTGIVLLLDVATKPGNGLN